MSDEQLYPCATPGCVNMRTKAQGGTTFTICDTCWDEIHGPRTAIADGSGAVEKPDHMKLCSEKTGFVCCSCGLVCCDNHGIATPDAVVVTGGPRRCTACADSSR